MQDKPKPWNSISRQLPKASTAITAALLLSIIMLTAIFSSSTLKRPPSFDGAMNLQVAYSLAHGEGYRRTYSERPVFPREIQTNVPFVVPAALVYKLFGVGKWQSQLTNFAYLCALLCVIFVFVRHQLDSLSASIATLLVLITPGMMDFSMNGYGEVPAIFWAIASLLAFPWSASRTNYIRIIFAGVFLGLALATKTVMLICFLVFGFFYVIDIALEKNIAPSQRLARLALLAVSSITPIVAIEIWRYLALGGLDPYYSWWSVELNAIGRQAGATTGYNDTKGLWSKLLLHVSLLSKMYGISPVAAAVWLVAPVGAVTLLLASNKLSRKHLPIGCLLGACALYLIWWLLVTPTQKAWHRRVIDATILLNITWVYIASITFKSVKSDKWKWLPVAAYLGVTWLCFQFSVMFIQNIRAHEDFDDFDNAVNFIAKLPAEAEIYGVGWTSSPALSLLSQRYFGDLNDVPASSISRRSKVYLAADTALLSTSKIDFISSTYTATPQLANSNVAQVYQLTPKSWLDTMSDPAEQSSFIDFSTQTAPIAGFYPLGKNGTRWMTSHSIMSMIYDGSPDLIFWFYIPSLSSFIRPDDITISASLNGCKIGSQTYERSGNLAAAFSIPRECRIADNSKVVLELSTDNLLRIDITKDERQLSVVGKGVGFSVPCSDPSECSSRFEELRRGSLGAGKAVLGDASLHVASDSLRCDSRSPSTAVVSWSFPQSNGSWKIYVGGVGAVRKLWKELTNRNGSAKTGQWVTDGMEFALVDGEGTVIKSVKATAKDCN